MRMQEGQAHLAFLEVARRARRAGDAAELAFVAVNDSSLLAPYRQAALWLREGGVVCLSGVVQVEANVPYVLWLQSVCAQLALRGDSPCAVDSTDFPGPLGEAWGDWLPAHVAWLPITAAPGSSQAAGDEGAPIGGLLLTRDTPWTEQDLLLLAEWVDTWGRCGGPASLTKAGIGAAWWPACGVASAAPAAGAGGRFRPPAGDWSWHSCSACLYA